MPDEESKNAPQSDERRTIMLWAAAAAIGGASGLAAIIAGQVWQYLVGPKLDKFQESEYLAHQEESLSGQIDLIKLRLERISSDKIQVAKLSELTDGQGKICIDYFLQPAIVLKLADDKCIARSAVCTHLGCTVQGELIDKRIYCACHMSYFDPLTGKPLAGPATFALAEEPITIDGDNVYLTRPKAPIKIGPTQSAMRPV